MRMGKALRLEMGTALRLAMATILALAATVPASAPALSVPSGIDARIRLDWEAGTRRGKPVIEGNVYNHGGRAASDVRLLVETLDASGVVTARAVGFVPGVVQANDRAYFEVPIKVPGPSYRVTVTSLDWRLGGAGG